MFSAPARPRRNQYRRPDTPPSEHLPPLLSISGPLSVTSGRPSRRVQPTERVRMDATSNLGAEFDDNAITDQLREAGMLQDGDGTYGDGRASGHTAPRRPRDMAAPSDFSAARVNFGTQDQIDPTQTQQPPGASLIPNLPSGMTISELDGIFGGLQGGDIPLNLFGLDIFPSPASNSSSAQTSSATSSGNSYTTSPLPPHPSSPSPQPHPLPHGDNQLAAFRAQPYMPLSPYGPISNAGILYPPVFPSPPTVAGVKRRTNLTDEERASRRHKSNHSRITKSFFVHWPEEYNIVCTALSMAAAWYAGEAPYPSTNHKITNLQRLYEDAVVKTGQMLPRYFGWAQSALLGREETQARSRVLKAVTPQFASVYNLVVARADGHEISDEQKAHNRSIIEAISEDFKFACSVIDTDVKKFKGKWLSPIVPRAAKAAWFKHNRAIGMTQPQFQDSLPNESIALIFTAVSHEATLWSSGVRVVNKRTKKFNLRYRFTYDKILGKLASYEKRNTTSWTAYRQKMIRDLRAGTAAVGDDAEDSPDEESDTESVEDDEDRELLDAASGQTG